MRADPGSHTQYPHKGNRPLRLGHNSAGTGLPEQSVYLLCSYLRRAVERTVFRWKAGYGLSRSLLTIPPIDYYTNIIAFLVICVKEKLEKIGNGARVGRLRLVGLSGSAGPLGSPARTGPFSIAGAAKAEMGGDFSRFRKKNLQYGPKICWNLCETYYNRGLSCRWTNEMLL